MLVDLKLVWFLTLFLFGLCLGAGRDVGPGYSYYSELNGSLKLHDQPVTWSAARTSCHMEGAFLASDRAAEFVLSMQLKTFLEFNSDQSPQEDEPPIYIGFHTSSAEGAFTSVNGKPAIVLYDDGLAALERCEVFLANGTRGVVSCDSQLPYVCFVPAYVTIPTTSPTPVTTPCPTPVPTTCPTYPPCPTLISTTSPTPVTTSCPTCPNCPTLISTTSPTPVTTPCPTCPTPISTTSPTPITTPCPTCPTCPADERLKALGYEFIETTGHWYKFHVEGKVWNDANKTCVQEGAHLAIINSDIEAQALVGLLYKSRHMLSNEDYWMSIGVHKDNSGVWRTVDGQTLKQAGYERWLGNFPFSSHNDGQMYYDGTLASGSDSERRAFICEREVA